MDSVVVTHAAAVEVDTRGSGRRVSDGGVFFYASFVFSLLLWMINNSTSLIGQELVVFTKGLPDTHQVSPYSVFIMVQI